MKFARKQFVQKVVFMWMAIVLTVTSVFSDGIIGSAPRAAADGASAMGQLDVTYYTLWINGEEAKDGITVQDGQEVMMSIRWRVNNNEEFLDYETIIELQGLVLNEIVEGDLFSDGRRIGTYELNTDASGVTRLIIHLDEEAIEGRSDIGGGALFDGEVSLNKEGNLVNGSDTHIQAGTMGYDVIYDDGTDFGSVTIKKSNNGLRYDKDNDKYYVDYTITAEVEGMIGEFTLSDEMPEVLSIVKDSISIDGGSTNNTAFPFTIKTENTRTDSKSTVKLTYTAVMDGADYVKNNGQSLLNTATADYLDEKGNPQSSSDTSTVKPKQPTISKTGTSLTEWITYRGQDWPVVQWTVEINPGDLGTLTDAEIELAIRSLTDTMNGEWGAYSYNYGATSLKSSDNDFLSEILFRYSGDLSKMSQAEYNNLVSNSKNFEKLTNGGVKLTYKTIITDPSVINVRDKDITVSGDGVTNTVTGKLNDYPLSGSGTVKLDVGIDIVQKDVELGAYSPDENKGQILGTDYNYSVDWQASGSYYNELKDGLDLENVYSDGILEVPFRIAINPEELGQLLAAIDSGSTITISDTLDYHALNYSGGNYTTQDRISYNGHHYIDSDVFIKSLRIYYGTAGNDSYTNYLRNSIEFTGATEIDGKTVYTGWKATLDTSFLKMIAQYNYPLVITYCTNVKMAQDADGNYVLDQDILDNGGYKLLNTVDLIAKVNGKTVLFNDSFNLEYAKEETKQPFGNIIKRDISGVVNYKDTDDIYLTDADRNTIGWTIAIPITGLETGDKLIITDTLGEGLKLVENPNNDLSLGHAVFTNSTSYKDVKITNRNYEDCKFEDYTIAPTSDGFKIEIDVTQEMLDRADYVKGTSSGTWYIRIYYVTSYENDYLASKYPDESVTFTNQAVIDINGEQRNPVSDDVSVDVPSIAHKEVFLDGIYEGWKADKRLSVPYVIEINEFGSDLVSGDTLTITDTMDECMSLDRMVKVEFKDSEGNDVSGCSYTVNGNVITFVIPDSKHVIISYNAVVNINPIEDPYWFNKVNNSFTIESIDLRTADSETALSEFKGQIQVWAFDTTGDIILYKYYRAMAGKISLAGAEFTLYLVYDNNGVVYDDDAVYYDNIVIPDSGELLIENLPLDMIYKLVETKSPEGYGDENTDGFYFILQGGYEVEDPRNIKNPTAEEAAIAAEITKVLGSNPIPVYSNGGYLEYENIKLVTIEGEKIWVDYGHSDEYRPDSITLKISRSTDGKTWETVDVPAEDINWDKTTSSNKWRYTINNLRAYDENLNEYLYKVEEEDVLNYIPEYAGKYNQNITNTLETIDLSITKEWSGDEDYIDEYRPDSITVKVLADGKELTDLNVVIEENEDGEWKATVPNLPKYDTEGKEITYTIKEVMVNGYSSEIEPKESQNGIDEKVFIIKNTFETVSLSGTKEWYGDEDFINIRPDSITIEVYAGSFLYTTAECKAEDEWKFFVDNLPKYNMYGEEIIYSVKEVPVSDYLTEIEDANTDEAAIEFDADEVDADYKFVVKNTFDEEIVDVEIEKIWDDDNNSGKTRPDSITICLLADGEIIAEVEITAAENETDDNKWTYKFESLPKYSSYTFNDEGEVVGDEEIIYTAVEVTEADYYGKTEDGLLIVNTLEQGLTSISGTKIWNDNGNKYGIRPDSITVVLSDNVNGELSNIPVWDKEANPDEWTYVFEDLPVYAYVDGEQIVLEYTVKEIAVKGYTSEIEGYDIKNTIIVEEVVVNKMDVANNAEVENATLTIYDEDGNKLDEWVSKKGEQWTIKDLVPGKEYTIRETVTPYAYKTAAETVFTVDEEGRIVIISGDDASDDNGVLVINDAMINTETNTGGEGDETHPSTVDEVEENYPGTGDMPIELFAFSAIFALTIAAVSRKKLQENK